jgi:hypothetical protein
VNFNHSVGIWHKDREKKQIFRKTAVIFFQKLSCITKITYFCITKTRKTNYINNKERKKGKITMAEGLKENWKKVGKDWASLGEDLGKSLIKFGQGRSERSHQMGRRRA